MYILVIVYLQEVKVKANNLTYGQLCYIETFVANYIAVCNVSPGANELNKCFAAVLLEIKTKVEIKRAGLINEKGYRMKLTPAQREAVQVIYQHTFKRKYPAEIGNALFCLISQNS